MQQPLLPITIDKKNPSYLTVQELSEVLNYALKNKKIQNVALTGPFGSGKSSIIQTLKKDYPEFCYLTISLATLQADQEGKINNKEENDNEDDKGKQIETLNRKIEYSILQQLIYKEKGEDLPNSRFRKIVHLTNKQLTKYSLWFVCFIIAFFIVFEPTFAKVDTICNLLDFGEYNIIFDILASLYILWFVYKIFKYIIKSYSNSKLNKLNLKDGDIEIREENSIFNKHLDEILYFFQVTNYNVVVIEDLDRFETESIFLKLRELNQLINESKIVNRHIVFLYAIKDDVFENEARTKFFDYITTVIPVINPSNSKDKLKIALKERNYEDNEIPDDDLAEIAFFIQDMRILTNIANEYSQYRQKLYDSDKKNLNLTKLLAMIVYKNYFPKDFAQLHRRDGIVYKCISSKNLFIAESLKVFEEKKKNFESEKKVKDDNKHLKESDLRYLFLQELCDKNKIVMPSFLIDNVIYNLKQISQNEGLFNKLYNSTTVKIKHNINQQIYAPNNPININIDCDAVNKEIKFKEKLDAIKILDSEIQDKEIELEKERCQIQSIKLSKLINDYNLGDTEIYKNLNLYPLMDVFIRRGYIDEDYYDYISYFYPGMVSYADRDLLLSMKRQIKQDYTYHIDKTKNFVKELKGYMFEHDAILNNDLLDYIAKETKSEMFTQIMNRLKKEDAPMDFLAQYYQLGKKSKEVFSNFIRWDNKRSWQMINEHKNDSEKQILQEAWLKYCDKTTDIQNQWINENFSFLSSRAEYIGLQKIKNLITDCKFTKIDNNNPELLNEVIEHCYYITSPENLCIIINFLNKNNDVNTDNLNLTRITNTQNPIFEEYIKSVFADVFVFFSTSSKDESSDNILYILNNESITSEQKISYLKEQQNLINDFPDNNEESMDITLKSMIIAPTWKNIEFYFNNKKEITDELLKYINHFHSELESKCPEDIKSKDALFKELLGTNKLDINAYHSICKAFDNKFDGNKELKLLEIKRLSILIECDKIVFSEKNNEIMRGTSVYPDYLIHYHKELIDNSDNALNIDANCAIKLLESEKISSQEKRKIITKLSLPIISESPILANRIIEILLDVDDISIDHDFLNKLLDISDNEKEKVLLVTKMLSSDSYDNNMIQSLLSKLGDKYTKIGEDGEDAILENNNWHMSLLNELKEKGIISSFYLDNDIIRIELKVSKFIHDDENKNEIENQEGNLTLSDNEKAILTQIKNNPKITTAILTQNTGLPSHTVEQIVKKLKDINIIIRVEEGINSHWEIIEHNN